jgi:prolyl-tRNA synthetase
MGSYGVGVSRLVAVLAEQSNDDRGLIWPRAVAPADVHLVIAGKDDTVRAGAEQLAADLDAAGVQVLLDDRTASPGVKFADAELIGVPTIVVVGRGLANGVVEVKDRASGERADVPVESVVAHLVALVNS